MLDRDDLLRPESLADPYPIYDALRAADPVHWNPRLDAWLVLRYDDVLDALNHPELYSSDRTAAFMGHLPEGDADRFRAFADMRRRMILYNDPPRHTELRRPVQRGMTVRLVSSLRPKIQQVTDDLLDAVAGNGECDAIRDIGHPLPVIINSELIGIPPADRGTVKSWTEEFIAAINVGGANVAIADLERGQDSVLAMREYFTALAKRKREKPGDDLVSALVYREEPMDDDDFVATCIVLLFAGLETALNLIGNGLLALLRHPAQVRRLATTPRLLRGAVEELLRYDGPLHLVGRLAVRDQEAGGHTIAAGDKVLLMFGAANRDPEAFTRPDELDIERPDNRHVAFSHGIHYCPGAELSRIEGEIVFGTIFRRLPGLRLADEPLVWQPNLSFRGVQRLPLVFEAGRGETFEASSQ
ncbi:MAG: cytochrome P450 [Trebonia sp.]